MNFDFALIDVPNLASSSNDLLEWERNAELMPAKGAQVWMVIEPAGNGAEGGAAPATAPAEPTTKTKLSDVEIDEQKVQGLIDLHNKVLAPRAQALREAAEAHYKVIVELRQEQQRLINEADRIQRAIDQIERDWADATTPAPAA